MADNGKLPLTMPALRGSFGDWTYYACLLPLRELAARVSYANELHAAQALSQLIQRSLEGSRASHIASYLQTPERFFNSLVLATYGGHPEWFEVGNFRSESHAAIVNEVSEESMDSLGFLRLGADAKIFAIDGQHRLAGIKKAVAAKGGAENDVISILLVGHRKTAAGLQRTRRLFTTLNKTAVPVTKKDIIALDEDDVMAITARRLVETNPKFEDPRIAVIGSANIPSTNRTCLTTISNLYDVLKTLFLFESGKRSDRNLRFNRPSDIRLDEYYQSATSYFDALAKAFPAVKTAMTGKNPEVTTPQERGPHGGHILFRPVGLELFTRVATEVAAHRAISIAKAVQALAAMPVSLAQPPYANVLWDVGRSTINVSAKSLTLKLMRYVAGLEVNEADLLDEYRKTLGPAAGKVTSLPKRLQP